MENVSAGDNSGNDKKTALLPKYGTYNVYIIRMVLNNGAKFWFTSTLLKKSEIWYTNSNKYFEFWFLKNKNKKFN